MVPRILLAFGILFPTSLWLGPILAFVPVSSSQRRKSPLVHRNHLSGGATARQIRRPTLVQRKSWNATETVGFLDSDTRLMNDAMWTATTESLPRCNAKQPLWGRLGPIFSKEPASRQTSSSTLLQATATAAMMPSDPARRILPSMNLAFWRSFMIQFRLPILVSLMATLFGSLLAPHMAAIGSFYMRQLAVRPVPIKALTAAVIGLTGDSIAQAWDQYQKSGSSSKQHGWDRRRSLSVLFDGLLVSGPLLHFAYNGLEHITTAAAAAAGGGACKSLIALTQVFLDDFFLDAVFVALMFVTTAIGEGHTKDLSRQFKQDYVGTVKASWKTSMFLVPIEFICFRFLPLSLRVLGMNFIDIFWGAMISFLAHRNRKHSQAEHPDVASPKQDELFSSEMTNQPISGLVVEAAFS